MRVAILTKDLFMSVRLGETLKKAGHEVVPPGEDPRAVFVDLGPTGTPDPARSIREMTSRGVRVVAFGPHTDAMALRSARAAGADVATSNGQALAAPAQILAGLPVDDGTPGRTPSA